MIYWPAKAPGEVEDFAFDFSDVLQSGETISTKTVSATGVTVDSSAISNALVQAWLSGGTLGTPGIVTCTITTSLNRTYSETAILPIGEEPVSLIMAKRHCRVEDDSDDEYLLGLIQAAREHVEQYTGAYLVPAAVSMSFAQFSELERLSAAPVTSLTALKYLDTAGVEQTLDPGVYAFLNVNNDVLRPAIRLAYSQSWPTVFAAKDAVRVSAVVGYTAVPRPLIQAMLLLIGQWFDNRSSVSVDARSTPVEMPNAVSALIAPYRRLAC